MKDVFLWILIGYMILNLMASSWRWISSKPDMTSGTLVFVFFTNMFFILGGLFVITEVWK